MAGTGLPSGALTQNNPALGTDARANGAGPRTRQGVSLKLHQFASPNERCSVESAPHQIVKECGSYHDNIRVGDADPLSWTK